MPNPDEWGPGSRSTSHAKAFAQPTGNEDGDGAPSGDSTAPMQGSMQEKRERNQNKRARKRQAREMSTGSEGDKGDGGESSGG